MNTAIQQNQSQPENTYTSPISNPIHTPPEIASKYTFIRQLGQGSQGTVYLAKRNNDNLTVAIKRLDIDSVQSWKEYDLFHREAEVLQNLNINGVAKFYEAPEFLDIKHPAAYIVQEYVDGQSLEEMIQSGFRFTLNRLFKWILKILDILEALHTHEPPIIHRDLKPNNIIMKPLPNGDFQPYLIDFGAVANPQVQSGGSTVAGTYGYMPPEQLMGKPVPASDIYSLAAMIAYIMSGVAPGEMQITDFHLIIEPHLENIPNIVIATLHQMLKPKVDKRLIDYPTLRDRFDMFASGKFEFSGESIKELDENQLLRVQKLGQRGNIDLWMALPDNTPREIPVCYQNLECTYKIDNKSIYPILKRHYIKGALFALLTNYIGHLPIGIIIFTSIFDDGWNIGSIGQFLVYLFLLCFAVLIYWCSISSYIEAIRKLPKNDHRQWTSPDASIQEFDNNNINTLLTKGSKSIATVIDCTFEPPSALDVQIYTPIQFTKNQTIKTENTEYLGTKASHFAQQGYLHTYPKFKLRYRFNPPDDDNPYDLVHSIYVHRDMSDILKPGSPLPILYHVDSYDKQHVMSMPFPFPIGDIASLDELYHR